MLPRAKPVSALEASSPAGDAALIRDMLTGSRLAWHEFDARYSALIHGCIARVISRFSRSVCRDDIGEIHATLQVQLCANGMAKLRSFDAERGRRLSSWIGLLAVNCAYDHLRALRNELGRASLDECEDIGADAPLPDELLDLKQRAVLAADILRDFSDKDRELISLYFGEGLAPEQIAERMRISVSTVYSKKHKIQHRIEARVSRMRGPRPRLAA